MIDLALPREQAALLSAGMERHCPVRELQAGFALFRDNRVTHAWRDQFNIVHAIVRTDDGDRKLQLDLDFFLASECGCGAGSLGGPTVSGAAGMAGGSKICAHMAAVFFLLYGEHADPAAWLAEVMREEERRRSGLAAGGPLAAGTAGRPRPVQEGPGRPDQWGALIDREMERLRRRLGDRRRVDIFYLNACRKLFSFAEPLPERERIRFRLFASLRIMLHAERRLGTGPERGTDPAMLRMVQDLGRLFADHAGHAAGALSGADAAAGRAGEPPSGDGSERVLLEQVRRSLPPPGRPVLDWAGIHRLLWSQLYTDGALRREEADRLAELAAKAEEDPIRDQIRLCIAHLHWLEGDDAAAMRELAALSRPAPDRLAVYWETLAHAGSWTRFQAWLAFALPHLQRADGDTFRRALEALSACRAATGDEAFLRRALAELLPRSADAYAAYLIETGRAKEWVAFHLLNGTPVDRLDREQRLRLERSSPELVLPLYHHGIERLLAARNRSAYRDIARLAKRLQALYRSLGKEDAFQAFMAELQRRNGRQHALMEELQKGQLLA